MVMRQRPTLADQRSHQWSMLPLQLLQQGGSAAIQAAISGAIGDQFKQKEEERMQAAQIAKERRAEAVSRGDREYKKRKSSLATIGACWGQHQNNRQNYFPTQADTWVQR